MIVLPGFGGEVGVDGIITVTFDAGGASGALPGAITQRAGQPFSVPGAGNLSRWDDFFDGWKVVGTDNKFFEGDAPVFSSNVTLEAQWVRMEGGI